jgi:hypothetical protein
MQPENKQNAAAPAASTPEIKKKKTFWQGFVNFLMMGGFIVVLIVIVGLFIVFSIVFKCK